LHIEISYIFTTVNGQIKPKNPELEDAHHCAALRFLYLMAHGYHYRNYVAHGPTEYAGHHLMGSIGPCGDHHVFPPVV